MRQQHTAPDGIESVPAVVLDRLGLSAQNANRDDFVRQPGYTVVRSHFLRSGAYERVLETRHMTSGATTLFYDRPRASYFPAIRVLLRAGDKVGLLPADVLGAYEKLENCRISLLELALDFPAPSGVTMGFLLGHTTFGKSRWFGRMAGLNWFGERRSSKLVRVYLRPEKRVLRVEFEFHCGWLRRNGIHDCYDFWKLPQLIVPRHISFCELDWEGVTRYIRRHVPNPALALRNLSWQKNDLNATLRFLRQTLGIRNTHRFLKPLALNEVVFRALKRWAAEWPRRPFKLGTPSRPNAR